MTISEHSPFQVMAYCPRCGSFGFEYDNEKKLSCKSCGFNLYINMSSAVAAIIRNEKDEILFTIRKFEPGAGLLDLPGGFVDLGETAEHALDREIMEELNLKIIDRQYYGSFPNQYLYGEIIYHTLDLIFTCAIESFLCLKAADDVSAYVFRNPSSVKPEEIGLDSIRQIIKKVSGKMIQGL